MARPGHTFFTALPSRTPQYPRAPRPLTPDKSGKRKLTHYLPSIPLDYLTNCAILNLGQIAATCAAARAHFLFSASLLYCV